jgi:DNA-binding transcriptional LysR family regulator
MKQKKPALQLFENFLIVADKLSFTRAAQALGITKAAVSHSVKTLETELGVDLLIRSTRKMHLTTEGELLYTQCRRLQYELDAARDLVGQFDTQPKGTLTISCNLLLAESHLLPKVTLFKQQFPKVKMNIIIEERMPDLKSEQVDIVFGVNWPAPLDVVAKKIGKTRYILCASPAYLSQYGVLNNIEDLENHHYIPHASRDKNTAIVSLKKRSNLPDIQTHMMANNIQFIKQCVLKGLGIAQFHDYAVLEELKNGHLVELLPQCFKEEETLYVYYQKHQFVQPKVRQFIRLLKSEN